MTRKEAIKVLKKDLQIIDDPKVTMTAREWEEHDDHMRDALEMAIEALEQEPKRGKWIDKGDFYVCSECGKRMTYAVLGPEFSRAYAFMSDYCPHCGSPMEVESDEE